MPGSDLEKDGGKIMAMICRNGAAECTGCMRCYDDNFEFEYENEEDLYND